MDDHSLDIEEIVNDYGDYIYRYALKLSCDPEKAKDIAQETFISAWKNISTIKEEKALRKWLQKICFNYFLMDYRKEKGASQYIIENIDKLEAEGKQLRSEEAGPEEEVIVGDAIRGIQNGCFYAMVRKLSLNQRIAFSLVDMFGMRIADVASLLELSDNAVKALLHRARTNLEHFFAGHCNLLDADNPCSCQAWIDFRTDHEKHVKAAREVFSANTIYETDKKIARADREKIRYLYSHMPESKPDKEWFTTVITLLKK